MSIRSTNNNHHWKRELRYLFYLSLLTILCYAVSKIFSKRDNCSPFFPVGLINEVTLYEVGESETFALVTNGVIPNKILDSIPLTENQWQEIIGIASKPLSDYLEAIDCFQPAFVVLFRGGYHNYVSHLTVSFSCYQLKYADNSDIHILSNTQYEDIEAWYSAIKSGK
ncbi:MAG: hypothetical protein AAGF89_14970 [Bacteroidota bacterium]